MTETVVAGALLAVGENGIGLAALLEALFSIRIVGIAVGMKLQGELAIGALNFLIAGGARDAQYLVIVAFHCRGQICLPSYS